MSASPPLPLAMRRSGWVLYVGLGEGLLEVTAVVAWADHWIMALPDWPLALTELSMPGRAVPADAISHLGAVLGEVPAADAFAITVALFDRAVAAGRRTPEAAIRRLTACMLVTDAAVPDADQSELWHLDYNAELEHPLDGPALTAAFRAFAAPYVAAWADAIAAVARAP